MSDLRTTGDLPSKTVVEYATIKVEIPHRLIPANLRQEFYESEDIVKGLYVSPTGRLTYKTLYLESEALAHKFAAQLAVIFRGRPYRDHYKLSVSVERTTKVVTATNGTIHHSAVVANNLIG